MWIYAGRSYHLDVFPNPSQSSDLAIGDGVTTALTLVKSVTYANP